MAIPTWRNVSAPSNAGANQLLVNAGNQVSQGINQLGSAVQAEGARQTANQANAFQQNLSSNIGQFGGDPEQYRQFVTGEVANNPNLSPEQRVATIDSAIKEQEALTGLTPEQQELTQGIKQQAARGLEDLGFQQQTERQNLQSELGYPLERFDWQNDKSLDPSEVRSQYAHLEDSGMNVQSIQDTVAKRLGRQPTGKELEGIIIDAAHGDMSLFNPNSVEVTNGFWASLAGNDLNSIIDRYKEGISKPEAAQKVRSLNRKQEDQTQAVTKQAADQLKAFTNQQRKANAEYLSQYGN